MKDAKQTLSERMAARQSEARAKIKAALWQDEPDGDAVAAVALAGGIPPAEVDKLAVEIETAKATLQGAVEAEKVLPGLRAKLATAKTEAEAATAALKAADAADDLARVALGEAEQAVTTATRERDAAALLLRSGTLPRELAPAFVREAMAREDAEHEAAAREARVTTLKRQTIPWLADRVTALETEIAKMDEPGRPRENTLTGGKLVDYRASLEHRLDAEKTKLKEARAELRKLEK